MKKMLLVLFCGNAFLYACDSSNDGAKQTVADAGKKTAVATEPAKESSNETATEVVPVAKEAASAEVVKADNVVASTGADESKPGESIYKTKCIACHGSGVAGAPKLGDKAAWAPRIAQGIAVLNQHAIGGFKGSTGIMPPKGGFASLSDEEILSTVEYMVSQSQ